MDNATLKKRRERLGLTQTELAEKIGIRSNTISGYETGRLEIPGYMDLTLEALEARKIKEMQSSIDR